MCTQGTLNIIVQERFGFIDEFELAKRNAQGRIVAERMGKSDGVTSADLAIDEGGPLSVSSRRTRRVEKFEEESCVAETFVRAFNARHGTDYSIEPKTKEDNDYPDRILVSENADPTRLIVQVRHCDTDAIASLGNTKAFQASRTEPELVVRINEAITAKARVDRGLKPRTVLVLQTPFPIGGTVRQSLQAQSFDSRGFREVWIAPFHDESFHLIRHTDVAVAAYYIWVNAGRPHGDDRAHWFEAIRELRGP